MVNSTCFSITVFEVYGFVVPSAFPDGAPQSADEPLSRSLASITHTDVLLVGLDNDVKTSGLNFSPVPTEMNNLSYIGRRAAWYSFGFFLRSAAAKLLDVDGKELRGRFTNLP